MLAVRIELAVRLRPMLSDPNDEMVPETAIDGQADAIVTFNGRDFRLAARLLRCSVLRPVEAVLDLVRESGR